MLDKIQNWATEGDMDGFDTLAAEDLVGDFDYMSLVKGVAGMAGGAGGLLSGGGGAKPDAAAAAAAAKAAADRAAAESSARTWKIVGGIAIGVLGLLGLSVVMRPAAAVKAAV